VTSLRDLAVDYIERVVNQRDLTAVDELVARDYRGSGPGWPTTIGALRQFYEDQMRDRPDWHIHVREAIELGDSVVLRAHASGTAIDGGVARPRAVEWMTHYRFGDGRIREINVLAVVNVTL
jgi:predicted SnoaL-like aldol condensation-catalyzing enzyme